MPVVNELIIPSYIMTVSIFLMMVLGVIVSIYLPGIDKWNRTFFITYYFISMLCMGAIIVDAMIYMRPNLVLAEKILAAVEYLTFSFQLPLLTAYLLHFCGEDWLHSIYFKISITLWGIFFIMLVVGQFTNAFYYVTSENLFYRGSLHPLLLFPLIINSILNLILLIIKRSKLTRRVFYALLVYMIPMVIMIIAHAFVYATIIIGTILCTCSFSMFFLILSEQFDMYMSQQREIAQQRASIMILQMRPHFIYNTMTSIYYLCEQDPKKAQQLTLDFNTYLRKNFNAIVSKNSIPFTEELEHTHAYLAVEQAQYEENLLVDYDTPHIGFQLPPLTLQPIVENAVKHGMDPDAGPLRIFIQTRLTTVGNEIIVEDNGTGMEILDNYTDTKAKDKSDKTDSTDISKSYITLNNIKQRLELLCNGTMIITPREGGGTTIKIIIP